MKKHLFILSTTALLSVLIAGCNGGASSNNNAADSLGNKSTAAAAPDPCEGIDDIDICKNAGGIWNLVIASGDAITMLNDFKSIYGKDDSNNEIKALDTVFWVDACTIFGIENFLKTQTNSAGEKYDGLRIHLGCEVNPDIVTYPRQQYPHKTSMFFFPTVNKPSSQPAISEHEDDRIKMTFPGACGASPYLQDNSFANPKIVAFDNIYRKASLAPINLKDSLSKSIWIDSCVLFTVAKILRLPNALLDGVNINMAAYNSTITAVVGGKFNPKQSTVIIVPSSWDGTKHENNWQIVDCLFKNNIHKAAPGGFNHGELCPKICPPEE